VRSPPGCACSTSPAPRQPAARFVDAHLTACCYLILACERARDYGRAARWCEYVGEARRRPSRGGYVNFMAVDDQNLVRANYRGKY
jgi:hypothetical protein